MPKHKVRVAWLRWGIMRPSLVYILFYSGIRASDKCKQVNSQDIVIRTRNSLEAGPFSIVPSHKLKICHKLHTCLFCFKNSCHMSLECFFNKSSPNHHSDESNVPMLVRRKKKTKQKRAEPCAFKAFNSDRKCRWSHFHTQNLLDALCT